MGKVSRNVWIIHYDEFEGIIDDLLDQVPNLHPAPHKEFSRGLEAGLNLALECARRRSTEAIEYDLEKAEANA